MKTTAAKMTIAQAKAYLLKRHGVSLSIYKISSDTKTKPPLLDATFVGGTRKKIGRVFVTAGDLDKYVSKIVRKN